MKAPTKKFLIVSKRVLKPSAKVRKTARRFSGYSGR